MRENHQASDQTHAHVDPAGPAGAIVAAQDLVTRLTEALKSIGVQLGPVRAVMPRGRIPEVRAQGWVDQMEKLASWVEEHTPPLEVTVDGHPLPAPPREQGRDPWRVASRLATALERNGVSLTQMKVLDPSEPYSAIVFWADMATAEAITALIKERR